MYKYMHKNPIINILEGHRWSKKELLEEIIYMDDHKIAFTKRERRTYRKDISPSKVYQAARKRFKHKDSKKFIGKHAAIKLAEAWYEHKHGYKWPLIDPEPKMNTPTRIVDRMIRREELAKAMYHAMEGYTEKKACIETAEYIFSFFGFNDYIVDNTLGKQTTTLRTPFYHLEDVGLLKPPPGREFKLTTMENWRLFQWQFRKEAIIELAYYGKKRPEAPEDPTVKLYNNMPMDVWVRSWCGMFVNYYTNQVVPNTARLWTRKLRESLLGLQIVDLQTS